MADKQELFTSYLNHLISDFYTSIDIKKENFMDRKVFNGVIKLSRGKKYNKGPIKFLEDCREDIKRLENGEEISKRLFVGYNNVLLYFLSSEKEGLENKLLDSSKEISQNFKDIDFFNRLKFNYDIYTFFKRLEENLKFDRETSLTPLEGIKELESSIKELYAANIQNEVYTTFRDLLEFVMVYEGKNFGQELVKTYENLYEKYSFIKELKEFKKFYKSFCKVDITSNYYPCYEQSFGISRGQEIIGYFEGWKRLYLLPGEYKIQYNIDGKTGHDTFKIVKDRVIEVKVSKDLEKYLEKYENINDGLWVRFKEFLKDTLKQVSSS